MDQAFGLVFRLDQFAALFVRIGVFFSVLDHLLRCLVRQAARGLDRDFLLFAGAFVHGAYGNDAVGVDVKGHFDLGHATWCWRDAFQVESAKDLVVRSHFTFALEDTDRHSVLVVFGCGENLRFLRRDRRVAVDQSV